MTCFNDEWPPRLQGTSSFRVKIVASSVLSRHNAIFLLTRGSFFFFFKMRIVRLKSQRFHRVVNHFFQRFWWWEKFCEIASKEIRAERNLETYSKYTTRNDTLKWLRYPIKSRTLQLIGHVWWKNCVSLVPRTSPHVSIVYMIMLRKFVRTWEEDRIE